MPLKHDVDMYALVYLAIMALFVWVAFKLLKWTVQLLGRWFRGED